MKDVVGNTDTVGRLQVLASQGNMPNLILAGPRSVSIYDPDLVRINDAKHHVLANFDQNSVGTILFGQF